MIIAITFQAPINVGTKIINSINDIFPNDTIVWSNIDNLVKYCENFKFDELDCIEEHGCIEYLDGGFEYRENCIRLYSQRFELEVNYQPDKNVWSIIFDEPIQANSNNMYGKISELLSNKNINFTLHEIFNHRTVNVEKDIYEYLPEIYFNSNIMKYKAEAEKEVFIDAATKFGYLSKMIYRKNINKVIATFDKIIAISNDLTKMLERRLENVKIRDIIFKLKELHDTFESFVSLIDTINNKIPNARIKEWTTLYENIKEMLAGLETQIYKLIDISMEKREYEAEEGVKSVFEQFGV